MGVQGTLVDLGALQEEAFLRRGDLWAPREAVQEEVEELTVPAHPEEEMDVLAEALAVQRRRTKKGHCRDA